MFPALRQNGLARWLAFVLALFGLAAVLLLSAALYAADPRGAARARRDSIALATAPEPGGAQAPVSSTDPIRRSQREPARGEDPAHMALVHGATEALAQILKSAAFEETLWRVQVDTAARGLGPEALPALRAVLADDARSPEEHVAASELVAALRAQ